MNVFILMYFLLIGNVLYSQSYHGGFSKPKKRNIVSFDWNNRYRPVYPLEVGLQVGTAQFLGDLGGQLGSGKKFIMDTDIESIRPTFGIFARYNIGGHFAARVDISYMQLFGDDKLSGYGFSATDPYTLNTDPAWLRYYRNLNFRTHVFEASMVAEIIPYNFELAGGYKNYSIISPYGFIGVGVFAFNPETLYNGNWVELKPLITEGQGLVEGRASYDLVQLNIPMGFGVKWSYNDTWTVALEINHRMTFTDYIDDVSGDYVTDESIFDTNMDPATASLAKALARRSTEIDPNGINSNITKKGASRGNPANNDSYYTVTIRFSFYLDLDKKPYGLPVW